MSKIGLVLLAAGYSRRFGGDKRLADLHGTNMLRQSMRCVEQVTNIQHKVLVLRPDEAYQQLLDSTPSGWVLARPVAERQGMGHSIAAGVSQIADCDAMLIMLADMPFVRPETLSHLAVALSQHPQVRPLYNGQPGHPVGFTARYFPALMACKGDQGARNVIQQKLLYRMPVDDPGVITDIDTREQWRECID